MHPCTCTCSPENTFVISIHGLINLARFLAHLTYTALVTNMRIILGKTSSLWSIHSPHWFGCCSYFMFYLICMMKCMCQYRTLKLNFEHNGIVETIGVICRKHAIRNQIFRYFFQNRFWIIASPHKSYPNVDRLGSHPYRLFHSPLHSPEGRHLSAVRAVQM